MYSVSALAALRRALLEGRPPHAPLFELLSSFHPPLAAHSERTATAALALARGLAEPPDLGHLELGALVHDLGKLKLPLALLLSPEPLTLPEREAVNRHPALGVRILEGMPLPALVWDSIAHHHERWDGRGYPLRLSGRRIPLVARILALADVWDTLTNPRPYGPVLSPAAAFAEIRTSVGQFDPHLLPLLHQLPLRRST